MTRLSQIIAIEKDRRTVAERTAFDAYHQLQKPAQLSGVSKTYTARTESDGETENLPDEGNLVQYTVKQALEEVARDGARHLDVVAAREATDRIAKADIVVDGKVFLKDVPATLLLALERVVAEELVQAKRLPTLSPEFKWTPHNEEAGEYVIDPPIFTTRTKKVPKVIVKAPATEKLQADTEIMWEDKVVGDWKKLNFSGAIPVGRKRQIVNRATKLLEAVKQAREEANTAEVVEFACGTAVYGYLYGDQ